VKTRRTDEIASPDSAVDRDKITRLVRAAREYAHRAGADFATARFDTVSIVLSRPPSISHLRDVFRAPPA
ncbi:MAG: YraN family protein, partial [Bryobacteraceae bacterium]